MNAYIIRRRLQRARHRLSDWITGWETFRPQVTRLNGLELPSYRVRPISWRRLLFGRRDAGRLR